MGGHGLDTIRFGVWLGGRHNVIHGSATMQASVRRSADRRRPPWGLVAKKSRAAQSNWPTRARGQILSLVVCKRQAGRIFGEKVVGSGPVRSYIHASVRHLATVADPWITLCRPEATDAEDAAEQAERQHICSASPQSCVHAPWPAQCDPRVGDGGWVPY